jgi:hypothetical protein
MPNVNAPRGFSPRKASIGAAWAATVNTYKLNSGYATALYKGDVVKLLATGYIAKAAPGDQFRGIVAGFKFKQPDGRFAAQPYWTAGTTTPGAADVQVMLYDDPNFVYEARFTNSASAPTQADVGAGFNLFDAGGQGGLSGEGIDYASLTALAAQFEFQGFSTRPENDVTTAYPLGLFVPKLHDRRVNTNV